VLSDDQFMLAGYGIVGLVVLDRLPKAESRVEVNV